MGEMLDELGLILGLVVLYLAKLFWDKIRKNNKKDNPGTTLSNPLPLCSGGHCSDHSQLMKDVAEMKTDTAVTKTNVEWIKNKLDKLP